MGQVELALEGSPADLDRADLLSVDSQQLATSRKNLARAEVVDVDGLSVLEESAVASFDDRPSNARIEKQDAPRRLTLYEYLQVALLVSFLIAFVAVYQYLDYLRR